jgi:hypothetical protein
MAAESKLEAARRTGSLTNVIGAMREEQNAQTTAASDREQVDIVDGSIRLAAHLTGQGKTGAERRQALGDVQIGKTVTPKGVAKTLLSRAEKIDRVKAWASTMTEEQRTEYMIGEKYGALGENAQDVIAEAFGQLDEQEANATDLGGYDFSTELVDVEALTADETEDEVVDDGDVESYEALFEQAGWEGEQS